MSKFLHVSSILRRRSRQQGTRQEVLRGGGVDKPPERCPKRNDSPVNVGHWRPDTRRRRRKFSEDADFPTPSPAKPLIPSFCNNGMRFPIHVWQRTDGSRFFCRPCGCG